MENNLTEQNEISVKQAMLQRPIESDPNEVLKDLKYVSGSDIIADKAQLELMKQASQHVNNNEPTYVSEEDLDTSVKDDKETVSKVTSKLDKLGSENIFDLKGIEKLGKKQKKRLYDNDTSIISIGETLNTKTESQERFEKLIELSASLKAKKPITAIIDGTDFVGTIPCAVIFYGDYKILIPYTEMAITEPVEIMGSIKGQENYKKMLLDMRIGSEIDFIVKGIDEKKRIVMASRKNAMDVIKRSYYLTKNKTTKEFYINEGCRVEARVTHVISWGIGVEVFGIECFIRASELSYRRIPSILEEYQSGDKVIVKITKLIREQVVDEEGHKKIRLRIAASVKQGKTDPRLKFFDEISINSKYRGVVTQVTEDGIFIRLGGEKGEIDCMCAFPKRGGIPPKGSAALVHISDKQEDTLFIYGSIVRWSLTR